MRAIHLHGHCHQKALASIYPTVRLLSLPENFRLTVIPSGCCGMAGSLGYVEEHYEVSMKIGEAVLFSAVRGLTKNVIVAALGTCCRHQIHDGTALAALHPTQILRHGLSALI